MPIDLTNFVENTTATIQFSYPAVDNINLLSDGSFFLPNNNSITPNFSYTDTKNNLNLYISGPTIKGYISSSNIINNPELVLVHKSIHTDTEFYVVIPLNITGNAKSSLSKLNVSSSVSLDLNSDIKTNRNIYHYFIPSSKKHVFVFETPIDFKPGIDAAKNDSGVSFTDSDLQKYKITRNTKVEDEVVCDYSEDAKPTAAKENKNMTTFSYSIAMFLINIIIIMVSLHIIGSYGQNISGALFGITVICALLCAGAIYLYRKQVNYLIIFGSLGATFAFVCILSFLSLITPFRDWFVKKVLPTTPTVVTPPKRSGTPAFLSI